MRLTITSIICLALASALIWTTDALPISGEEVFRISPFGYRTAWPWIIGMRACDMSLAPIWVETRNRFMSLLRGGPLRACNGYPALCSRGYGNVSTYDFILSMTQLSNKHILWTRLPTLGHTIHMRFPLALSFVCLHLQFALRLIEPKFTILKVGANQNVGVIDQ